MQEIVKFCDKILAQTKENIKATDTTLKSIAPTEEYHNIQVLITKDVESNKRSLNQRKTRKFNKIKYQPRRNTSNEKRKNTNRQEINREFQPPREIFKPRETPNASSRESSSEKPRRRERDQQNTTTKRPTYAEILSRPESQNQQTRPRRQISFQRERRKNRSVQFREVNGELEEGKSEGWIPKNYQTASVGNRDLRQLL